jgi:hypothetical protein
MLVRRPPRDRPERLPLPRVPVITQLRETAPAFAVAADGLYYVDCTLDSVALHLLDMSTGRDENLGALGGLPFGALAVSPDGRIVLYPRMVSDGSDIMLIE